MLDEIRRKPRSVRERYAFLGALSATGLIAAVWLVATFVNFSSNDPFSDMGDQQTAGAFSQFFSDLKEDAGNIWQGWSASGPTETASSSTSTNELIEAASPASLAATSTPVATSTKPAATSARAVLIATSSSAER